MGFFRNLLDNDSRFGQFMTRCGIVIAANLLFVVCSLPVVTIGVSWTALHYTMLKTLREKELNPFSTFWHGLKDNLKQATVAWLAILVLTAFLSLEIYWCSQFEGVVAWFRYGVFALLLVELLLGIYLFPVMAAFKGTIRQLLHNCIYFAFHRPLSLVVIAIVHVVPLALTYLDAQRMPLYAFLWCFFGFAVVAMYSDSLLLKQFNPYQTPLEEEPTLPREKTEREILKEMERMGG